MEHLPVQWISMDNLCGSQLQQFEILFHKTLGYNTNHWFWQMQSQNLPFSLPG